MPIIQQFRLRLLCDVPGCDNQAEFFGQDVTAAHRARRLTKWEVYPTQAKAKCPTCIGLKRTFREAKP